MINDFFKDLVEHTHALGNINLIKVNGEDESVLIDSIAEDNSVIVHGKTKISVKEIKGIFGMPNLNKLDLHLKNPEYKENAKIEIYTKEHNGETIPFSVHFENSAGDFKNEYKLMGQALTNEKIKIPKFSGATWNVVIQPSVTSITRMKLQAAAHNEETVFLVKTEENDLKFYFGDPSTHEGNFTFYSNVEGKLKHNWNYPISQFISILNLSGDKTIKFSDEGVVHIIVDSGLTVYDYYIPAQIK